MIKELRLKEEMPDEDIEPLAGQFLDHRHYDMLVTQDVDVYKPNGEVLLKFRKGVIPASMCAEVMPIWELAATPTDNRGIAAGGADLSKKAGVLSGVVTANLIKGDGTLDRRNRAKTVNSGVVGFLDRSPSFPYCRLTAFTAANLDKFNACMPFIAMVDSLFKELMPNRHKAQMEHHSRSSDHFKIPNTSFTTITCNKNFRTACHRDQGDLKEGFGIITALRAGNFRGCYLIFPKYRIAVDLQTTDLICCDVHSMHANSPIFGIPGTYKRISLVFYFRAKIAQCSSADEETQKAIARTEKFYNSQATLPL